MDIGTSGAKADTARSPGSGDTADMGAKDALILVVDDTAVTRELLAGGLGKRGYRIALASGGGEALSAIEAGPPDLVLLDLMMPEVDGFQVLGSVRKTFSSLELPIIVVSAKDSDEDVVEALALGANDYVTKPLDFPVLLARVESHLARKRAEDDLRTLNQTLEREVERRSADLRRSNEQLRAEIADRKRVEREMSQKEEWFCDFSKAASDWFWEIDDQYRMIYFSKRISELSSFEPRGALGMTRWEMVGADVTTDPLWRGHKAVLDARQAFRNFRYSYTGPDGHTFHFLINGRPVLHVDGSFKGYRGTGTDETAEVESKERMRDAERLLIGITRNLPGIIFRWIVKPDGSWEYPFISAGARALTGFDQDELKAGGYQVFQAVHGDDFVEVSRALKRSARDLSAVNIEYRMIVGQGEIKWVQLGAQPQRLESGDVVWDGLLLDISDRKNLEFQLVQAQKLEAVGQLAAGIAHEINTPTQYVSDNTRFLHEAFSDLRGVVAAYAGLAEAVRQGRPTADRLAVVDAAVEKADMEYLVEEIPKAVDQSMDGLQRITLIVSAMKEFSHPEGDEKELCDLNQIVENTVTVSRNEWKYVAEVEATMADDLPMVPCYRDKLGQVLLNVIVNAAHAIEDVVEGNDGARGVISIDTRRCGELVEVRISDTGTGIPDDLKARIFDPFFTTKGVGKGTGQGLAIARSIVVDKHGGSLTVESVEGQGTTFVIGLPFSSSRDSVEEDAQ